MLKIILKIAGINLYSTPIPVPETDLFHLDKVLLLKKSKKKALQEEKANPQQVSKFLWVEPETMLDNSKKLSSCCAK